MKSKTFLMIFCIAVSLFWLGSSAFAANSALVPLGADDVSKIPIVLIHGIHGTEKCEERGNYNGYWKNFKAAFDANLNLDLKAMYSLYVFQYCSDKIEITKIALELRDLIDENLTNRNHFILAHSMGGLVAKAYMAETVHLRGEWKNKTGGDTTIGIITLATPHHGTPGANSTKILKKYIYSEDDNQLIKKSKQKLFELLSFGYWGISFADSTKPNRSDLRWDNYDFKLDDFRGDINESLARRNILFQHYSSKLIAYAGYLDTAYQPLSFIKAAEELEKEKFSADFRSHKMLTIANFALVKGLGGNFGSTDGLVPFDSGLFCNTKQIISLPGTVLPKNFICLSFSKVRRFEPGKKGVAKSEYPDANTLSIFRTQRGYDHLDMLESPDILKFVIEDLRNIIKPIPSVIPIKVTGADIPTLFLLDISGSMNENDKIGQARSSSLIAMRQIQENKRLGRGDTSVSVWTFNGGCSPNMARQILPFTNNLPQAENTLSAKIPRPDGGTPLPQAVEKATNQTLAYLNSHPELSEGRIILLSDGQSTCGEIRPAGVYSQAKIISVKKIRYLTIGFDVPPGSPAERDLQYLASASGGQYFPAQNQQQLSRAFEKTIRVFLPKAIANAAPEFENVTNAILNRDFGRARQFAAEYLQKNPSDAFGYYNLAVSLEALSRYKGAAENYRKYLQFAPGAADRRETEARIEKLEQDQRDQFFYYQKLLKSDLDYLKAYYQRLFNRENEKNAAEFAGFVAEKQEFYANLTDILEIRSIRIAAEAKDLSDSLGVLNRRVHLSSFDRDAVSLLTISIGQLEDVAERIENYRSQNVQ